MTLKLLNQPVSETEFKEVRSYLIGVGCPEYEVQQEVSPAVVSMYLDRNADRKFDIPSDPNKFAQFERAACLLQKHGLTGYNLGVSCKDSLNVSFDFFSKESNEKLSKYYKFYREWFPGGSYRAVFVETAALWGFNAFLGRSLKTIGFKNIGNSRASEIVRELKSLTFLGGLLFDSLIPAVTEELIFRGAFGFLGKSWGVGIVSTSLFALVHNLGSKDGKLTFLPWVPLQQFLMGLYCWNTYVNEGIGQAIFAHSVNNALSVGEFHLRIKSRLRLG